MREGETSRAATVIVKARREEVKRESERERTGLKSLEKTVWERRKGEGGESYDAKEKNKRHYNRSYMF